MSTATKFYYRAKARDGSLKDGSVEAATLADARKQLRDQSLFPLEIAATNRPLAAAKAARGGLFRKQ